MKILEVFSEFSAIEIVIGVLICLVLTALIYPIMYKQRSDVDSHISVDDLTSSFWSALTSKTVIVVAIITFIVLYFI